MTPEAETILFDKLTAVLRDLHEHAANDGEAMFMLGSGADYVCQTGKADSWPALKQKLGNTEKLGLLAQLDAEGQQAVAKGQPKLAYALQMLGLSITATASQRDDITAAADLIDTIIVTALSNYRQHAPDRAPTIN